MLNLQTSNALDGLRAALEAPEAQRLAVFRARVMAPLKPFWEPLLRYIPLPPDAGAGDTELDVARAFGYYSPEQDVQAGLAALDRLAQAEAWARCVDAVERSWAALAPEQHGIALEQVRFTFVLANPAILPESTGGYTGSGGTPGLIAMMAWPNDYNLPRLPSATAHEANHNIRFSFEPFTMQTTLGQYMVAEGLAEAFAVELYGEDKLGPWAQALSEEQVTGLIPHYREVINLAGFNEIRGYIFGDWAVAQTGYTAGACRRMPATPWVTGL